MKILILEGIATSGKTTIKNKLEKYFDKKDLKYLVVEEDETLMPILHNTTKRLAIAHLKKVIEKSTDPKGPEGEKITKVEKKKIFDSIKAIEDKILKIKLTIDKK